MYLRHLAFSGGLATFLLSVCVTAAPTGPDAETLVPVPASKSKMIPPPRTRGEVDAIMHGAPDVMSARPIHVVLVAGKKDHGPGEHDYPAWQKAWEKLLAKGKKVKVTSAWERPTPEDFASADVMVIFRHRAWPKDVNWRPWVST